MATRRHRPGGIKVRHLTYRWCSFCPSPLPVGDGLVCGLCRKAGRKLPQPGHGTSGQSPLVDGQAARVAELARRYEAGEPLFVKEVA